MCRYINTNIITVWLSSARCCLAYIPGKAVVSLSARKRLSAIFSFKKDIVDIHAVNKRDAHLAIRVLRTSSVNANAFETV